MRFHNADSAHIHTCVCSSRHRSNKLFWPDFLFYHCGFVWINDDLLVYLHVHHSVRRILILFAHGVRIASSSFSSCAARTISPSTLETSATQAYTNLKGFCLLSFKCFACCCSAGLFDPRAHLGTAKITFSPPNLSLISSHCTSYATSMSRSGDHFPKPAAKRLETVLCRRRSQPNFSSSSTPQFITSVSSDSFFPSFITSNKA